MLLVKQVQQHVNGFWLALAFAVIAGALIFLPLTNALVVIGGALAVLALLRWHELALSVLIFAVPYGSWFPLPTGFGNLTAVDLFVALIIALWLARMIVQGRAITVHFPPLVFPFVLFLGAAMLSMTIAISLEASIKELTKWFEMFAIYVYVANNLDESKTKRLLAVMFLAGMSEAAIGIYQFLFRVGPEGFSLFGSFMRAYGTFEQPNPYAGYLALITPIAFGVVVSLMFQVPSFSLVLEHETLNLRLGTWALSTLALISLLAMLAAVVMSWSRGAWLGVGAGMVVTIIVQSRRAFVLSIIVAFLLTFAMLLSSINVIPSAIADRFAGITDYFGVFDVRGVKVDDANFAIVERMAHWQSAAMMFADNPVFGVGIGNYAVAYPQYSLPRWDDPLGHAHNYYLNIAAETGLIGLLAYLILWASAFWQSWSAVRTSRGLWRSVAAGLLGMLVALSVHNGFDNLFVHGMAVQVGIGLGIVAIIRNSQA